MSTAPSAEELLASPTIQRLRRRLLSGGAPSTPPGGGRPGHAPSRDPVVHAVMRRIAPIAELLLLMMLADGNVDGDEMDTLRGAVRTLTDGMLRTSDIDDLIADVARNVEAAGRDARLDMVAATLAASREDAEAAYLLAAVIAAADGHFDEREQRLLTEVGEVLGIPPTRRREILGIG